MKRQKMSACRLGASAIMISGTVATIIAAAMTRLRPSTSAIAPENGAEIAIASVVTVMVRLICAGVASNSRASEGSSDCGPYRLKKAQKPGMPTAARRKLWFMAALSAMHALKASPREWGAASLGPSPRCCIVFTGRVMGLRVTGLAAGDVVTISFIDQKLGGVRLAREVQRKTLAICSECIVRAVCD